MRWHRERARLTADGGNLYAEMLIPGGRGPFPAVVMCHGLGSDHRSMIPSAQRIVRRGVAVLTFDFRGHGRSGGVMDGNMGYDVVAAVDYLHGHQLIDPARVALVGHSMGAMAVLHAATMVDNLRAAVLISSPAELNGRFTQFWAPLYPRAERSGSLVIEFPHIGPFPMLDRFSGMTFRLWMWIRGYRMRIDLGATVEPWEQLNPYANIEKLGAFPKLFVHCKGDKWIPYQSALSLYERAAEPKEMLLASRGFHVAPLMPGRLRGKWISWLVSAVE